MLYRVLYEIRYIKIFLNIMKVVFKKGSVNQEFVISWVRYIKVRLYHPSSKFKFCETMCPI